MYNNWVAEWERWLPCGQHGRSKFGRVGLKDMGSEMVMTYSSVLLSCLSQSIRCNRLAVLRRYVWLKRVIVQEHIVFNFPFKYFTRVHIDFPLHTVLNLLTPTWIQVAVIHFPVPVPPMYHSLAWITASVNQPHLFHFTEINLGLIQ